MTDEIKVEETMPPSMRERYEFTLHVELAKEFLSRHTRFAPIPAKEPFLNELIQAVKVLGACLWVNDEAAAKLICEREVNLEVKHRRITQAGRVVKVEDNE